MQKRRNAMREQFDRDGFYVFEDILNPTEVDGLNALSDRVLAKQEPEHFSENLTPGSMVMIDWAMAAEHMEMAELIANPRAIVALGQLGFHSPKFGHGRIISKPPYSPRLFWHQDGRFWDDPVYKRVLSKRQFLAPIIIALPMAHQALIISRLNSLSRSSSFTVAQVSRSQ